MKPFEIVQSDMFDKRDLEQMTQVAPRLRGALGEIEDATRTGTDLGADLWSSLIRIAPRKADTIPPSHRLNETVIDRLWQADEYRDLHEHTMGDPVNAAAGVAALAGKVTGMVADLGDVAEQAEKAQDAQDALDEALNGGSGDEPGGPGQGEADADELESLRSKAEAEAELLDAMLDDAMPKIDRAVRAGLDEAAAEADANAAAADGWDLSPGELERMDPAERIRLMESLSQQRMRDIADLMGAFHNTSLAQRDHRFELRPGEVTGVTLGSNLARLVPAEIAALAMPELEDLMILRAVKGRARIYQTRAVERVGRGAVIYLEDQSGSMDGAKGKWSKAFGGALYRVAREQDRAFHAFCFKGRGVWDRFDFPNPREVQIDRLLEFMSTKPSGGTEVTGPLDEAVRLLEDEYLNNGNLEGDLVLATDGEVGVPPAWLDGFQSKRELLGFHVYGLAIRARISTLNALCTHVADVTDLSSGKDVRDVFATVQ